MEFKNWIITEEGCDGYLLADLVLGMCHLNEAKKVKKQDWQRMLMNLSPELKSLPPPDERKANGRIEVPKFDPDAAKGMAPFDDDDDKDSCEITPLSSYAKHIKKIQKFAHSSPENFAQTMMFSPLSANTPFPKHWDNFYVLMLLLKHVHPHDVTEAQLKDLVRVYDDKYHSLGHTISGWKLRTIAEIWSNKENLFQELMALAARGTDRDIIARLCKFTGVQPVKAGFIAQLLFGRAGCIDTHNIDIYSTVFPDMAGELGFSTDTLEKEKANKKWQVTKAQLEKPEVPRGVDAYVSTLEKLKGRGVGTEQLWNVWVDFVENFYRYISEHGRGAYTPMGAAADMSDPLYKKLSTIQIPKILPAGRMDTGDNEDARKILIPLMTGRGEAGSATHLQLDPDTMFKQHVGMYKHGEPGGYAASSIPFATLVKPDGTREPLEKSIGLADKPGNVHYFGKDSGEREIDPDFVRYVNRRRLETGGRKGAEERDRVEREKKIMARVPGLPGMEDLPPPRRKRGRR